MAKPIKKQSSLITPLPPLSWRSFLTWKTAFMALTAFSLVTLPILSFDYGIIWDEWIQSQYGKLVLKFILSGGRDQSFLTFGETMYLYGGFFDSLTAAVYGILFDSIRNVANYPLQADLVLPHWHATRHVINALFGFTAILFTGLTAQKIAGWRAGTLAFLFMLLSPRFLGNSMNNPKDIPFATAAAIFIFFMIRLFQEMPQVSWKTLSGVAASIALAINIKVGGILFLCYVWLFVGSIWIKRLPEKNFSPQQAFRILIPISLMGYFGGLLFWPYGLLNPFTHPLEALAAFSKFGSTPGKMLFDGLIYSQDQTPWYYLPKWILISNPLFLIASFFLLAFTFQKWVSKNNQTLFIFLLFCSIFPIAYAILKNSNVYDSWRHFLFVYPSLIVLAALAWDHLISTLQNFRRQILAFAFLVLLLFEPLSWMVRNHPNETVYFNPLVGGLRGAYGKYETDYWGNCLRPAAESLVHDYRSKNQPSPVVIRSDGEAISSYPFLMKGLGRFFVPYQEGQNEWKYSLEFSRNRNPQDLQTGAWPGPHAVSVVSADQVPLCAVIEKK